MVHDYMLQCALLLALLLLKPAAKDWQHWQGSLADWEEAHHQLEANKDTWAPPGTFAAALSTFQAALQDAGHTTDQLKQVTLLHCNVRHEKKRDELCLLLASMGKHPYFCCIPVGMQEFSQQACRSTASSQLFPSKAATA